MSAAATSAYPATASITWDLPGLSTSLGEIPQRLRAAARVALAGLHESAEPLRDAAEPADLARLCDEDLIRRLRDEAGTAAASRLLDQLFRRHQERVAGWCYRICSRREEAADLAQEVFLRVQQRLHTFRFESSFSTWLYLVTRSVAINRGMASRRRAMASLDDEGQPEPIAESPDPVAAVDLARAGGRLRAAIRAELTDLERRVLYLHVVDELTLPGIDRLLGLTNRSGAKAYLVAAKRKLRRLLAEAS